MSIRRGTGCINRVIVLATFLLVAMTCTTMARGDVFSDMVNGVGGAVSAVGGAIGRFVGAPIGALLQGATDPVLDGAATRLTQVANGTADRIDQTLNKENVAIDGIVSSALTHVDTLMKTRIDQIDTVIDENLKKVESAAYSLMEKESSVVSNALDRVETISNSTLERIQEIESNGFDRVDAALQDEVPIAASEIAHEAVYAALVVIFLIVLVGFGGVRFLNAFQRNKGNPRRWGASFAQVWETIPAEMLSVALPMAALSAAVLSGYQIYLIGAGRQRVSRLEAGAALLERSSDFKLAAGLRRRAFTLSSTPQSDYSYKRDLWLADFTNAFSVDALDLVRRFENIDSAYGKGSSKDLLGQDGEMQAGFIYLQARYGHQIDRVAIEEYRKKFLAGKPPQGVPTLGKLVLITDLRRLLDVQGTVSARLSEAEPISVELVKLYPRYSIAHLIAARLAVMSDALNTASRRSGASVDQRDAITVHLTRAAALDPDLMRFVRLANASIPDDLVKDISSNPRQEGLGQRLQNYLKTSVLPLARKALGSEMLAKAMMGRSLTRAIRRGVGELRISEKIQTARVDGPVTPERLMLFISIAEEEIEIGNYGDAEAWREATHAAVDKLTNVPSPIERRILELDKVLNALKLSTSITDLVS